MTKKLKFLTFYFVLIFLLIEGASFNTIKILKKKLINDNPDSGFNFNHINTEKYLFNPYINHKDYLKILDERPEIYLDKKVFSDIFEGDKKNIVLFQGDSWIEQITDHQRIFNKVKKFGFDNNVSIISAGEGSYSISLYIAQLKILHSYYQIFPKTIVLIIDQTDLGDDLYQRSFYPHLLSREFYNVYKNRKIILNNDEINIKNLNLIKILQISYIHFIYYKKIYNASLWEALNIVKKKIIAEVSTPLQLQPLRYGVNSKEEKYFYELLKIYYELAISKDLENLVIVTHPHLNHLNKKYKLSLSKLVDNFIIENNLKNKITHINFEKEILNKKIDYLDLFVKNDIFSHLTIDKYLNYFYPKIFLKLKKVLNNSQ